MEFVQMFLLIFFLKFLHKLLLDFFMGYIIFQYYSQNLFYDFFRVPPENSSRRYFPVGRGSFWGSLGCSMFMDGFLVKIFLCLLKIKISELIQEVFLALLNKIIVGLRFFQIRESRILLEELLQKIQEIFFSEIIREIPFLYIFRNFFQKFSGNLSEITSNIFRDFYMRFFCRS